MALVFQDVPAGIASPGVVLSRFLFSGDLRDARRSTKRPIFFYTKTEGSAPTCQVFGPNQHQHAAQEVEAQRRAAEDATLSCGPPQTRRTKKRRNVAAFQDALIFVHTETTGCRVNLVSPTVTVVRERTTVVLMRATKKDCGTWICVPLPLETGSVVSQFMDFCTAFFQRA